MTALLAPENRRTVSLFSTGNMTADKPRLSYTKKDGKSILNVSDVPVFRSGVFRDSMGFQHTWEDIHISQMEANFDYLRKQGIFVDVPVRKGHGSFLSDPMDSLIGWHTGLTSETRKSPNDGKDYAYLLATFEIFDEEAQKRIEDGNWRNRSSEIGFYLTNAEAEFWPCYMGFAYVDIPAVEGLNFNKLVKPGSSFMFEKEALVGKETDDVTGGQQSQGVSPGDAGQGVENVSPASPDVAPAEGDTTDAGSPTPEGSEGVVAPESPPTQVTATTKTETTTQNSAAGTPAAFTVQGRPVSDFAAVQQYITSLEQFQAETVTKSRSDFVTGLSDQKKIPATQIDSLTEFALGLSDEQFSKWSASYESFPSQSLFGQHGVSATDQSAGESADKSDRIAVLEGVVSMHSRTMPPEQVQKTKSYLELQQLKNES